MKRLLSAASQELTVVAVSRSEMSFDDDARLAVVRIGDLHADLALDDAMKDVDVVIHAAGLAHQRTRTANRDIESFRQVNVRGTERVAKAAVRAGVRRLIFLSSIKVNGDGTTAGAPYRSRDPVSPVSPYAVSKFEAENQLTQLAERAGIDVVIVRPVLVYGPGVKANFRALMRAVKSGIPLPFGSANNRRSLVYVGNLCAFIEKCLYSGEVTNRTFLVSDGDDISTADLVRRLACAMDKKPRLVSVPETLMRMGLRMCGAQGTYERLFGNLQVVGGYAELSWNPPYSVDQGIECTVSAFLESSKSICR